MPRRMGFIESFILVLDVSGIDSSVGLNPQLVFLIYLRPILLWFAY